MRAILLCAILLCSAVPRAFAEDSAILAVASSELAPLTWGAEKQRLAYVYAPDAQTRNDAQAVLDSINSGSVIVTEGYSDRYGVAYVMLSEKGAAHSLQHRLLREGRALLFAPLVKKIPKALIKAEKAARKAQIGLWKKPQKWQITAGHAMDDASHYGQWRMVRGTVHSVAKRGGHVYINFAEDWKSDFTVFVPQTHSRAFSKKRREKLVGKNVEVRGVIYRSYGPMIDIAHPSQLTVTE